MSLTQPILNETQFASLTSQERKESEHPPISRSHHFNANLAWLSPDSLSNYNMCIKNAEWKEIETQTIPKAMSSSVTKLESEGEML